jgi:eukaryotic-like serine/threonine-protein kinase
MSAGRLLGGRYQVGELLGYGGMAEVHQGRDSRLGRDVAIKLLRADLARDATFQMRFSREAQNAAALNHPAIVAVYDTGEEFAPTGEALPYIVMEYVNGRTLKEVLTAEGPLQPRRALEISADVCAALEFSHRHGIIHRDIKPGNVMLTQTGQVKVMDFGIARALASGASTMTQTSAVIGTAQYLSPEQARGEAVDARSDVYATGCVVFELLTGHPPFVGDNPVSVAYQHVREDPKPPSSSNRDVTPDLDAVVLKALAKNPLNRYQSAAEMRADLLRAANGRPVLATPVLTDDPGTIVETAPRIGPNGSRPTLPARVGNPQRRRASTWVMVALSVLGLVAVIALGTGLYLTSRTQQTKVPNVLKLETNAAITKLVDANLKISNPRTVTNPDCDKGTVISTDPVAGTKVDVNTTVNLVVCGGSGTQKIPQMVTYSEDTAKSLLELSGFTNYVFNPVSGPGAVNTVLSVNPAEGTAVAKDALITVNVSKGDEALLPALSTLKGQQAANVLNQLQALGFTNISTKDATSHSASDVNAVLNMKPNGDPTKPILKTTPITLYVGLPYAPPTTTPPPTGPSIGPSTPSPSPSATP